MKKIKIALITAVLIMTVGSAGAETRYIKDIWNVGLYTEANGGGRSLGLISSGTKLKVIAEQGSYTQVQTSTGEIGWTKSTYLVSEPTHDIKLQAAKRKIDTLQKKIQMLSDDNASVALSTQLSKVKAEQLKLLMEYTQQKQEIETLQAKVGPETTNDKLEKVIRLLTIVFVTLVCGFIVGKRMTEKKVKARFNGMKVW